MAGHIQSEALDYFKMDIKTEEGYPINPLGEKRITQGELLKRHAMFYDYPRIYDWKLKKQKEANMTTVKGFKTDPDPIVATVMQRMADRSKEGIEKYGETMMRTDVNTIEWIDHAIEELLDGAIYLERVKADLSLLTPTYTLNNIDNLLHSKGSSNNNTK